jgi:hypothetical protein
MAHQRRPPIPALSATFDQLVEIGDVTRDGERLGAAATLERFEDAERIRQSARDRRHISRRARAAVQDDHLRSRFTVRANAHDSGDMLLQFLDPP